MSPSMILLICDFSVLRVVLANFSSFSASLMEV
jgi:hypothetical protein